MLRVPGSRADLFSVRARGGDVRIVYSPLDAIRIAARQPGQEGGVLRRSASRPPRRPTRWPWCRRKRLGLTNFYAAGLPRAGAAGDDGDPAARRPTGCRGSSGRPRLHGDGHVRIRAAGRASIGVPIVVTGFEPLDLLEGVRQLCRPARGRQGRGAERVRRGRSATTATVVAQQTLEDVFEVADRPWRGIGMIPKCGWTLRDEYAEFDAELRVRGRAPEVEESAECASAARCCRAAQTQRVPGVRQGLHAAHPAGRDDGVE